MANVSNSIVLVEAIANCAIIDIWDTTKPDPVMPGKLVYDILGSQNILQIPRQSQWFRKDGSHLQLKEIL